MEKQESDKTKTLFRWFIPLLATIPLCPSVVFHDYHIRGMRKFGRPDISMTNVPGSEKNIAAEIIWVFHQIATGISLDFAVFSRIHAYAGNNDWLFSNNPWHLLGIPFICQDVGGSPLWNKPIRERNMGGKLHIRCL